MWPFGNRRSRKARAVARLIRARFDAALAALEGPDFWNGLTLVYEQMAEMHLQMSKFTDALAAVDRRIDLARRHGNNRMEAEAWEQKARAHERLGQRDEALAALRHSLQIAGQAMTGPQELARLEALARADSFRQ